MKGFIKRLNCLLCTVIIIVVTTLSAPLKAQATAIPGAIGSEATAEALMVLWNLVMNSFVASGAVEAVADYDTEKSIMDAFMDSLKTQGVNQEYVAYLTNGQNMTLDDLIEAYDKGTVTMPDWWVDEWEVDEETGEDVITLPNEQVWGKYRVGWGDDFASILEAWEERGGGGGDNGEPEEPKEPEFNHLKTFAITGGFLAMINGFIDKVWNGEVEECILPIDYGVTPFSGYTYNESGQIVVNMHWIYEDQYVWPSYYYAIYDYTNVLPYEYNICAYIEGKSIEVQYGVDSVLNYTAYYGTTATNNSSLTFPSNRSIRAHGFRANFPIFETYGEAVKFIKGEIDYTCALNYKAIEFDNDELISSIPTVMAPMADTQLSPSVLQSTYTGMKNAYETDIKTNTSTDVATNTQTYTETMKDVVTETVPQYVPTPQPTPEPEPTPNPDAPADGTGTETGTDIDDYKRDLRMLFPFCLPFDFIALLQALDAEPETPYFEIPFVVPALDINMSLAIDLSFLDDVMEGLRKFELVGFIVFLIFASGKLIKW